MAATSEGRIVRVSMSELMTGELGRPLSKEDLDVLDSYLQPGYDPDSALARDAVMAWRAGRAAREARELAFFDAIFDPAIDGPIGDDP